MAKKNPTATVFLLFFYLRVIFGHFEVLRWMPEDGFNAIERCEQCKDLMNVVIGLMDSDQDEEAKDILINQCLNDNTPLLYCTATVTNVYNYVKYMFLEDRQHCTANNYCARSQPGSCISTDDRRDWSISLPPFRQHIPKKILPLARDAPSTFKILHLSDAHLDFEYGAFDELCGETLCCRNNTLPQKDYYERVGQSFCKASNVGQSARADGKAGPWGSYERCDIPPQITENMLKHIKENHQDIDAIYYTGDTVDHAPWMYNRKHNTRAIKYFNQQIKTWFKDTPVYLALGNHESELLNAYSPLNVPEEINSNWLYELMGEEMIDWLPTEAIDQFKKGGFYSVLAKPGLKVVVLNTNVCYMDNWWTFLDPQDPYDQLKWLVGELDEAEANDERVHVITHIPTGIVECDETFSREYKRIVDRFATTITAQFTGHTHLNEFYLAYDSQNQSRAINSIWNGGAATTFVGKNPNYVVFTFDSQTFKPQNFESWVYNVTEANLTPDQDPVWYKQFSFKESYDLDAMDYEDVDKLVHRMATNRRDLLLDYYTYKYKKSDRYSDKRNCDSNCQKDLLCDIVTYDRNDRRKCEQIKNIYDEY